MAQTYIGYSPDVEVLGEDEERLTAEILEIMATTNRRAFERHRHAVRDAHAKSHGFLKGELIVHELPSHPRTPRRRRSRWSSTHRASLPQHSNPGCAIPIISQR